MFKIFAALATSMVGGALLLANAEPRRGNSSPRTALLLHARGQGSSTIVDALAHGRWDVVVLLDIATHSNPLSRNNIETHSQSHVLINEDGQLQIQPSWRRGRPVSGYESAMVIRVVVPESARAFGSAQSDTLALLLQRLDTQFSLPFDRIRYHSRHPHSSSLFSELATLRGLPAPAASND